jgi:LmbE family N-acetylglucosaminyl deacetylase
MTLGNNKKACVIVAHPDDETIWMGETIQMNPQIDWTIMTLCRASDTDRAPKFERVCERYGAKPIMADLDDLGDVSDKKWERDAEKIILDKIGNQKFDYIFTHGSNGEYGHPNHKSLHHVIQKLRRNHGLVAKDFFYFHYKRIYRLRPFMKTRVRPTHVLKLSDEQYAKKRSLIVDIYGFDPNGIDVNYCTNPEAFLKN